MVDVVFLQLCLGIGIKIKKKGIRSEGYNNLSDIKKRQYLDAYIKVNSVDLEILEEIKKLLDKYK